MVPKDLLSLNGKSLGQLLKALATENQAESVGRILQVCLERRVRLDAQHYTIGLTSCGSKKLWQEACQLFAAMPASKLAPNVT